MVSIPNSTRTFLKNLLHLILLCRNTKKEWYIDYTNVLHNVQNVMNNEIAALMNIE